MSTLGQKISDLIPRMSEQGGTYSAIPGGGKKIEFSSDGSWENASLVENSAKVFNSTYEPPPNNINTAYTEQYVEQKLTNDSTNFSPINQNESNNFSPPVTQQNGLLNSMLNGLNDFVNNTAIPGFKPIIDKIIPSSSATASDKELYHIGKPYAFNSIIDPKRRIGKYIRTKMSIIDLIPCDYSIAFNRMKQDLKSGQGIGGALFQITYDKKIEEFVNLCRHHGLQPYKGLRLFTTDDTTASDTFNIQYKDSVFQGPADKLSEMARSLQDLTKSTGSGMQEGMTGLVNSGNQSIQNQANKILPGNEAAVKSMGEIVKTITDIVLKGTRLNFPKIWQNSTHTGNLSTVIKLVSPYGSPRSIYEFIIKPLAYLILLSSAQTNDGVSYGNSIPLTIKAYGMNYTILGAINSITLRRGGNDTSFNVYRQPLTIDVSVDFQTLFDGFAVFTEKSVGSVTQNDKDVLSNESNLITPSSNRIYGGSSQSPLTTMGSFLESLKPIDMTDGNTDLFQVYGDFSRPTDTTPAPTNTGLKLNSIGSVFMPSEQTENPLNQIANSLKTLIPSEFSATYNTAKETISQVSNDVNRWKVISTNAKTQADVVRNKVRSNFAEWGKL